MVPAGKKALVALFILAAVIVSVQAGPTLTDILHRKKAPAAAVGTAALQEPYDSYGVETKEICLQEIEQKYCDYTTDTFDGYFWTSDFVCCQEDYHNNDPTVPGQRNTFIWTSQNSAIGSCDWVILYTDYLDLTYNIYKMGYAWATCYFGPEAESCGGPLCDRLVMSLQGTAYYLDYVYTYWGEAYTDGNCDGIYSAQAPNGTNPRTGGKASHRKSTESIDNSSSTEGKKTRQGKKPNRQRRSRSSKVNPGALGAHLSYNQFGQDPNREVYEGEATIIMGIVSALAGQRKDKWEEGVFEYVPYYSSSGTVTDGIDASFPWIRDKTYQMTFFRHSDKY